jgi:hypothetical protein
MHSHQENIKSCFITSHLDMATQEMEKQWWKRMHEELKHEKKRKVLKHTADNKLFKEVNENSER